MIAHILKFTIPAAYAILPEKMESDHATAMLLAVGLQESGFEHRHQFNGGPARSFWMFEVAGVTGVLRHQKTREHIDQALRDLCYGDLMDRIASCYKIIEHSDTLACVFARLLLWTLPVPLPSDDQPEIAYSQYLDAWRPGRPRRETWDAHYAEAWRLTLDQHGVS